MFQRRLFTDGLATFVADSATVSPHLAALFYDYVADQKTRRVLDTQDSFYELFNDFADDTVRKLGRLGEAYTRSVFAPVSSAAGETTDFAWYSEKLFEKMSQGPKEPSPIATAVQPPERKVSTSHREIVQTARDRQRLMALSRKLGVVSDENGYMNENALASAAVAHVVRESSRAAQATLKEISQTGSLPKNQLKRGFERGVWHQWKRDLFQAKRLSQTIGDVSTRDIDSFLNALEIDTLPLVLETAIRDRRAVCLKKLTELAYRATASVRIVETASDFFVNLQLWQDIIAVLGPDSSYDGVNIDSRRNVMRWCRGMDAADFFARVYAAAPGKLIRPICDTDTVWQRRCADGAPNDGPDKVGPAWGTLPSGGIVDGEDPNERRWVSDLVFSLPGNFQTCAVFAVQPDGFVVSIDTASPATTQLLVTKRRDETLVAIGSDFLANNNCPRAPLEGPTSSSICKSRNMQIVFVAAPANSKESVRIYTFSCEDWPTGEPGRVKPQTTQVQNVGIVVVPTDQTRVDEEGGSFAGYRSNVSLRFTVCNAEGKIIETSSAHSERVYYAALTEKREIATGPHRLCNITIGDRTGRVYYAPPDQGGKDLALTFYPVDIHGERDIPDHMRRAINLYPTTSAQFICLWSPGGREGRNHLQFFSVEAIAGHVQEVVEAHSRNDEDGTEASSSLVGSFQDSDSSTSLIGSSAPGVQESPSIADMTSVHDDAETSAVVHQATVNYAAPFASTTGAFGEEAVSPSESSSEHNNNNAFDRTESSSTSGLGSDYFQQHEFSRNARLDVDTMSENDHSQGQPGQQPESGPTAEFTVSSGKVEKEHLSKRSRSSAGSGTDEVQFVAQEEIGERESVPLSFSMLPDHRPKDTDESERSVEEAMYEDSLESEEAFDAFLPGIRQIGNVFQNLQSSFA